MAFLEVLSKKKKVEEEEDQIQVTFASFVLHAQHDDQGHMS